MRASAASGGRIKQRYKGRLDNDVMVEDDANDFQETGAENDGPKNSDNCYPKFIRSGHLSFSQMRGSGLWFEVRVAAWNNSLKPIYADIYHNVDMSQSVGA